jgi:Flp pilus assembly protein TadG
MLNHAASEMRPKKRREKGSAMLEIALVFLTLISMVIFILDMGRVILMEEFITERTRATVRAAVVNNWDSTAAKNYLVYNSTTSPGGGGAGYLGLQTSQVTYTKLGTSGNPDYRLQIKVTGVPVLTWIPRMAGQYALPTIVATMPAQSLGAAN